jgi:hypothetical protein
MYFILDVRCLFSRGSRFNHRSKSYLKVDNMTRLTGPFILCLEAVTLLMRNDYSLVN